MAAYRGVFRTGSNIHNEAFFANILNGFMLLTIFGRKAPLQMFDWVENGFWLKIWNIELTFVPSLQVKSKNTQSTCDIVFEKVKARGRTVKQNECLCRSSRPKRSLKNALWEISQNTHTKKHVPESLFRFFVGNFGNLQEHLFWRRAPGNYSIIISSEGIIGVHRLQIRCS